MVCADNCLAFRHKRTVAEPVERPVPVHNAGVDRAVVRQRRTVSVHFHVIDRFGVTIHVHAVGDLQRAAFVIGSRQRVDRIQAAVARFRCAPVTVVVSAGANGVSTVLTKDVSLCICDPDSGQVLGITAYGRQHTDRSARSRHGLHGKRLLCGIERRCVQAHFLRQLVEGNVIRDGFTGVLPEHVGAAVDLLQRERTIQSAVLLQDRRGAPLTAVIIRIIEGQCVQAAVFAVIPFPDGQHRPVVPRHQFRLRLLVSIAEEHRVFGLAQKLCRGKQPLEQSRLFRAEELRALFQIAQIRRGVIRRIIDLINKVWLTIRRHQICAVGRVRVLPD